MASRRFVPEAMVLYLLKQSRAFDWACINCQCRATGGKCGVADKGKWQISQGETGIDFVAKLRPIETKVGRMFPSAFGKLVFEAKGDRVICKEGRVVKINRPAYNEMVGSLCAFLVANFDRISDPGEVRLFGWLYTTTFSTVEIGVFSRVRANLKSLLPNGRPFILGVFDVDKFWDSAPEELRQLATAWFVGPESVRNQLLAAQMSNTNPSVSEEFISGLYKFELVRGGRAAETMPAPSTSTLVLP